MQQIAIQIKDMSVIYNEGQPTEFRALKNINLEIYENEYVIFFGPSGSGKSTLMYTIAGLESPTKGSILFRSKKGKTQDIHSFTEDQKIEYHRSSIGMVFQAFYLVPSLTAKENVLLPAVLDSVDPKERERRAQEYIERFGIVDFKDRVPARLSGGQQQRVAIARSLINNPEIILADEPVGNLDSDNAALVVDVISELNKTDNKTVIHVTHDPRHLSLADRVFYIKDGEIVRTVVNSKIDKPSLYKAGIRRNTVLDKISSAHPYATDSQIKAKLVVDHILSPYTFHEMERIEQIISSYLLGQINFDRMQQLFDLPEEQGGVNLYKQTAQKLAKEVSDFIKEMREVESEEKQNIPLKSQAIQLVNYLADKHEMELSMLKEQRAIEAIAYRLSGHINNDELSSILDESVEDGGVGLNKRHVDKIMDEIELLLAQKQINQ